MRRDGFSVLIVLAALAVIAALAGALTPMFVRETEVARQRLTVERMRAILSGMIGIAPYVSHGYLGDMGAMPSDIQSLLVQGGQPAFTPDANGIGTGWSGPYVRHMGPTSALSDDLWGTPFSYDGVTPQLTSLGPDRALGTADDITIPATPAAATGDLELSVLGIPTSGPPVALNPSDVQQVQVSYSNNGAPAIQTLTWNGSSFARSGVHRGLHAVTADGTGSYAGTTATVVLVIHAGSNRLTLALEQPGGEQILEQNTSGGDKMEVKQGQKGSQSFRHGTTATSYLITKLVLRLSRDEEAPSGNLTVSIGTGINSGAISESVPIFPSAVPDSAGSSFATYEVTFATPVAITGGTTYYLNFENEASNGKAFYLEFASDNTYSNGTYFEGGSDKGKDAWFQVWGN